MTENLILKRFKLWKKKSTGIKMTENLILKRFKLLEEKKGQHLLLMRKKG